MNSCYLDPTDCEGEKTQSWIGKYSVVNITHHTHFEEETLTLHVSRHSHHGEYLRYDILSFIPFHHDEVIAQTIGTQLVLPT